MKKRVLLKLSGEAIRTDIASLSNYEELRYLEKRPEISQISNFGVANKVMLTKLALDIKQVLQIGVELAIVIGGGNICRGSKNSASSKDRLSVDKAGMLATVINGLVLSSAFNVFDIDSVILSSRSLPSVCELYDNKNAKSYLKQGKVVICVGGLGQPFFSTDTVAVVRACELECDAVLKGTKVNGIYASDPTKNLHTKRFSSIPYDDFLRNNLEVMDLSAISIAKNEKMLIEIFCLYSDNSIFKAINSSSKGSEEKSVIS